MPLCYHDKPCCGITRKYTHGSSVTLVEQSRWKEENPRVQDGAPHKRKNVEQYTAHEAGRQADLIERIQERLQVKRRSMQSRSRRSAMLLIICSGHNESPSITRLANCSHFRRYCLPWDALPLPTLFQHYLHHHHMRPHQESTLHCHPGSPGPFSIQWSAS